MAATITGAFYNAKACTIDGRDHFIAFLLVDGMWRASTPDATPLDGFDTEAEARSWLAAELTKRAAPVVIHDRTSPTSAPPQSSPLA